MKKQPYIGITGFMSSREVSEVIKVIPKQSDRKFMVGVLASNKTISGLKNRWHGRYSEAEKIAEIFPDNPNTLNLIHYGDGLKTFEGLGKRLIRIAQEFGGKNFHGFQLNIAWPKRREICLFREYFPEAQIVIQVRSWSIKDTPDSAKELVQKIKKSYGTGEIDYIILDLSGGIGIPLSPAIMIKHLEELYSSDLDIGITVAGGLSAENLELLDPIVARFPDVSIDAEGRLRSKKDDHLILSKAKKYTRESYKLFKINK